LVFGEVQTIYLFFFNFLVFIENNKKFLFRFIGMDIYLMCVEGVMGRYCVKFLAFLIWEKGDDNFYLRAKLLENGTVEDARILIGLRFC